MITVDHARQMLRARSVSEAARCAQRADKLERLIDHELLVNPARVVLRLSGSDRFDDVATEVLLKYEKAGWIVDNAAVRSPIVEQIITVALPDAERSAPWA